MTRKKFADREGVIDEKVMRKKIMFSFGIFLIMLSMGGFLWLKLYKAPASADNIQPFLRSNMEMNERIFSSFYSAGRPSKPYKKSDAVQEVRVNGDVGMDDDFDTSDWKLRVARAPGDTIEISDSEILALPKTDVIFDFKCVEGWSQVTHWGGVRFIDFLKKYNLVGQQAMKYVGMETPDGAYYVGVDMPSMMQPQTILCYEMNGAPLPKIQGAPLRLIIPVKYGIKHIKRISLIFFSNTKPRDYWAEQGYDYYAGL